MLTITHEIRIEGLPAPVTIACRQGTFLLDAMVAAGLPIAYCCRAGICGMCKTALTSGEVSHDSCSDRALSPEERSSGHVLTCRASPLSACVVRPLNILGSAAPSFSGTLGAVVSIDSMSLPVGTPLFVVTARVQEARQLGPWRLGHWGWLASLDGQRPDSSVAACHAGTHPTDPCIGYWVLRDPELEPATLAQALGTVLFFEGPQGTPFDAEIGGNPFVVVADALGMPFVGALAWRTLLGDAVRADAVLFASPRLHPAPDVSLPGNVLSPTWSATTSADVDPKLLTAALSARAAQAASAGKRMRIVARGTSSFQNALRRAIRGSGIRQWDVHGESTLDLERVPPES